MLYIIVDSFREISVYFLRTRADIIVVVVFIVVEEYLGTTYTALWAAVNAACQGDMDPSMFVAYTPQVNGVPLESKLATYMVIHLFHTYISFSIMRALDSKVNVDFCFYRTVKLH